MSIDQTETVPDAVKDEAARWEALALEARQLAELAEQTRATIVRTGAVDTPEMLDELRHAHAQADEASRATQVLAGQSRRTLYEHLRQTMDVKAIAEAFGYRRVQSVYNVLNGRPHRTPAQKGQRGRPKA